MASAKEFLIKLFLDADTSGGDKVDASLKKIGDGLKSLESVGKSLSLYLTAPLTAFAGLATKTFMDFEAQMSRVGAISGATAQELSALTAQARELGATTRFSGSDAAQAMSYLAMSGFKVQEIQRSMPSVLQLAAAATLDMGTAANITSNILRGFGLRVEELAHANDVLVKAFTSSNTDLRSLGEAMKYAAPIAKSAGQSIEDITAAVGALGNAGIQGTMAGTAIRGAISSLVNPSRDAQKVLKQLGVETKDASGNMRPFLDIIGDIGEATDKTDLIFRIFGQRAASAVAALCATGGAELKRFSDALKDSGGTTERIAKQQEDNLRGAMYEIESAIEEAQIAIQSSGLGKAIREVLMQAYDLITAFNKSSDSTKKFVAAVGLTLAAIGPTILALTKFVSVVGTLSKITASTTLVLRTLAGGFSGTATAATAATLAVRAFRAAISTIGIGLVIWGVSELAMSFLDSAEAAGKARSELEKMPEVLKNVRTDTQATKDALNDLGFGDVSSENLEKAKEYFKQLGIELEKYQKKLKRADRKEELSKKEPDFTKPPKWGEDDLVEFENRKALVKKIAQVENLKYRALSAVYYQQRNLKRKEKEAKAVQEKEDLENFKKSKKRFEQAKKSADEAELSAENKKIAKEKDLKDVEIRIEQLGKDGEDKKKTYAERANAYNELNQLLSERLQLKEEIKKLDKEVKEDSRAKKEADREKKNRERKANAASLAKIQLEILQAQASGDLQSARALERKLAVEKEIATLKESSNLGEAEARKLAEDKVAAQIKIENRQLAQKRQSQLVEAQIVALQAEGRDIEARALEIRARATEYAREMKISYADALKELKRIDELNSRKKAPKDDVDTRYGKNPKQLEREQAKIQKMLDSSNYSTIRRGEKAARKFEEKYGIGVDEDVRNYRGRNRKTGELNAPSENIDNPKVRNKAYSKAYAQGALPDAGVSIETGVKVGAKKFKTTTKQPKSAAERMLADSATKRMLSAESPIDRFRKERSAKKNPKNKKASTKETAQEKTAESGESTGESEKIATDIKTVGEDFKKIAEAVTELVNVVKTLKDSLTGSIKRISSR